MLWLGIETSCDDTGIALVEDGRKIHSSVMKSQHVHHKKYGGVAPEIASRVHLDHFLPTLDEALQMANKQLSDIDGIAVTEKPGLMGSLLIGVEAGRTLGYLCDVPVLGINHLQAHFYSIYLHHCNSLKPSMHHSKMTGDKGDFSDHTHKESVSDGRKESSYDEQKFENCDRDNFSEKESEKKQVEQKKKMNYPMIAILASGGHSVVAELDSPSEARVLALSTDDACGECFDKVADWYGLDFPGGPAIEKMAIGGDEKRFSFPLSRQKKKSMGAKDKTDGNGKDEPEFMFSFSGLKTAAIHHPYKYDTQRKNTSLRDENLDTHASYLKKQKGYKQGLSCGKDDKYLCDLMASFQYAAINELVSKTFQYIDKEEKYRSVGICGGVACNERFSYEVSKKCRQRNLDFFVPEKNLCVDNGAMIAGLAGELWIRGKGGKRRGGNELFYLNALPTKKNRIKVGKNSFI